MNAQQKIKSEIDDGCSGNHETAAQKMADWMPNLIIIGAPKSATSTLAYTLSKHKNIFCCQPSEPKFFGSKYYKGWDWYSKIFFEGRNCKIRIEASTKYSSSEELFKRTPELIHHYIPNTKLVYLTRSPIKRTISHWRHYKGRFHNKKQVPDFHEILDNKSLYERIVQCSMYFKQLKRFRQYFPDEHIHCITFEDLTTKPIKTLDALFKFANVKGNPEKLLRAEDGSLKLPHQNQAGAKERAFIEAPNLTSEFKARLQNEFRKDSRKFLKYIEKPAEYWE